MFGSLRTIAARPTLLLLAMMIFAQGSAYGSTLPYLSVVAIQELGLSNAGYSLLIIASSCAALLTSITIGILSDRIRDRSRATALLAIPGVIGYGAIFLVPSVPVFVIATVFAIPFFQAIGPLIFVRVRGETEADGTQNAAAINATVRAFMSASWVVAPAAVGLVLAGSSSMVGAWGIAALCALCILLGSVFGPRPRPKADDGRAKPPGILQSIRTLASPDMLARVVAMGAVTGTIRLSGALVPLILTAGLGAPISNVGLVAGLTALLEIPFMLVWAGLLRRLSLMKILVSAAAIYAAYMSFLPLATAPWHIYGLSVLGAAGAAALLSMPLSYFQDLFPDRPGLGTAFNPINALVGNALAAGCFAIGTPRLGYSGTALLGSGMAIVGIGGLILLERRPCRR